MRSIVLAAAFFAVSPLAIAQTTAPGYGTMAAPPPAGSGMATGSSVSGMPASQPMRSQMGGSDNCGTPDEPKACPPMPRRALDSYPANR